MGADVVSPDGGAAAAQAGRVAAGVGAALPGVGAGVRLFEEGLGQDLLPPGAGLRVHDRVEERLQIRVQVLGDMDDLLSRRGRHGGGVHHPTLAPMSRQAGRIGPAGSIPVVDLPPLPPKKLLGAILRFLGGGTDQRHSTAILSQTFWELFSPPPLQRPSSSSKDLAA